MSYVLSYRVYVAPLTVPLSSVKTSPYLLPNAVVRSVDVSQSTGLDFTAGISVGVTNPPEASLTLIKNNLSSVTSRIFNWRMANVAVQFSTNGINYNDAFAGFIDARSEDLNTVLFRCVGYLRYMDYYRHATPLWRDKPVATAIPDPPEWSTTTSGLWRQMYTNQDPATLSGFFTGTVNTVFWLLGGRPYKLRDEVSRIGDTARFWYDCDHAPITPSFTWFNQEEITGDFALLAASAGGQITQLNNGVVKFLNPHSFVPAADGVTVNDSMFRSISVDEVTSSTFGKAIVTFSPRMLGANKAVLDSTIGVYLPYNEEYTHEVEFQQPVDRLTNNTYFGSGITYGQSGGYFGIDEFISSRDFIKAVDYNGETATVNLKIPPLSGLYCAKFKYNWTGNKNTSYWSYRHDVTKTAAQFMKITVKSTDQARSLYLSRLTLYGIPVVAGEPQTIKRDIPLDFTGLVTAGIVPSGFREVSVKENPYVQSKEHAVRLLEVVKYLHKRPRPLVRIIDMVYNSSLEIGNIINLNSVYYGLVGKFKVTEIIVKNSGAFMDISCVDVSDIKTREELFIIGDTYENNTIKYLSW
jgi:hypothetical protein